MADDAILNQQPAPDSDSYPDIKRQGRILVASNRGPVSFGFAPDGTLSARRGGGGMVSGLMSALATVARHSDVTWICAALSDADRAAGRLGEGAQDSVRMLDIPADTFNSAYNAVANSTLWFIHHLLFDTPNSPYFGPVFARDWDAYVAYNEAFAAALAEEAGASGGSDTGQALIQDFHLTLVPRMLRDRRPDIRTAHFSHTPWAPPAYYRLLPDRVAQAVLDGILGADHAGFLCQRWADAFLDCCETVLGATVDRNTGDRAGSRVTYRDHVTDIGVHPLGVDAPALRERAQADDVTAHIAALQEATKGRKLIVRVDRTELSKNIVRGLAAYREFLASHPEWHGRVVHLAFAYPSRSDLAEYRAYTDRVQQVAREINEEFRTPGWDPLILEVKDDYPRSLAACRLADVLLINPIRDGMNLVAEEGPVLSDNGCVLVLSREAGAAAVLGTDALLVNPYDISETSAALHQALTMPDPERKQRCAALAATAASMPPAQWLSDQLTALS
jgi:trehalose 6-phosphate synthase